MHKCHCVGYFSASLAATFTIGDVLVRDAAAAEVSAAGAKAAVSGRAAAVETHVATPDATTSAPAATAAAAAASVAAAASTALQQLCTCWLHYIMSTADGRSVDGVALAPLLQLLLLLLRPLL